MLRVRSFMFYHMVLETACLPDAYLLQAAVHSGVCPG